MREKGDNQLSVFVPKRPIVENFIGKNVFLLFRENERSRVRINNGHVEKIA